MSEKPIQNPIVKYFEQDRLSFFVSSTARYIQYKNICSYCGETTINHDAFKCSTIQIFQQSSSLQLLTCPVCKISCRKAHNTLCDLCCTFEVCNVCSKLTRRTSELMCQNCFVFSPIKTMRSS